MATLVAGTDAPTRFALLKWVPPFFASGLCRANTGTIPRLTLEGFLAKEFKPLLVHLDGATMLELLEAHTLGVSSCPKL
jgi:hypothetical protein